MYSHFIHTNCLEKSLFSNNNKKHHENCFEFLFLKNKNTFLCSFFFLQWYFFFMLHFHCYFNVFKYRYVVTFYIHFLILKTISYWSLRNIFLFLFFLFLLVVVVLVVLMLLMLVVFLWTLCE